MTRIEPKTLKGFRDFLPEKQIARQKMIETIKASYETFGFEPLETPVLEYAEILTGKYGDEGDKLMYRFKDNGDRDVAMRYDLTIPLARVVAQYDNEIKKPFKRYQISPVWRADNTQKGRFREFYQCDVDVVGSTSPLADAEIVVLAASTLRKLGVKDFLIRVNDRKILNAFFSSLGLDATLQTTALRTIDKTDKIGNDAVEKELVESGIAKAKAKEIVAFSGVRIGSIEGIDSYLKINPQMSASMQNLREILAAVKESDPTIDWVVDFSIARGLDYYTGIIFETNLRSLPGFGSVYSGGRYDNLIGMFSNKQVPAVGISMGFDRLYAALEELNLIKEKKTTAKVLVVNFDEALIDDYLKMASDLRAAGINTMLYFDTTDMKKQLAYASDKGIKYALIYGSNEAKEGKVTVKDLEKGTQEKVDLKKLTKYFA